MKKLKVFFVVFFAAIMLGIGTGVVTVQAYKVPEPNYLAIGLSMLTQNRNSAVVNPLDSETIARIENGSITLQEIEELKSTLQDSINQGFKKWQMQHLKELGYRGEPDNETVRSMLFAFLEENSEYWEQFKLYDQLYSLEMELKMENLTKQVLEALKNTDLIMEQGQLVREWNTTITIDGENCTAINQVYELEVNGTILTFIKVSIYSPDGVKISDPWAMMLSSKLIYWTKVWIWTWFPFLGYWLPVPVWYGSNFQLYCRYIGDPSSEAAYYYNEMLIWFTIEKVLHEQFISDLLGTAVTFALTGNIYGIIAAGALVLVALDWWVVSEAWYNQSWQTFYSMYSYNLAQDPSFGFMVMDEMHLVWDPQQWDPLSWAKYYWIRCDGLTYQYGPPQGGAMPIWDSNTVNLLSEACLGFLSTYGEGNWVWLGEWVP
ncbi:MAG: hypothetical protein ACETWM_07985 [Candidatus Lokiarchaeia archaeon]